MNWRSIAGIVCALYLSVGAVSSAVHDHSGDALHGDRCMACAWHHQAMDLLAVGPILHTRQGVFVGEAILPVFVHDISLGLHPSRGPPSCSSHSR